MKKPFLVRFELEFAVMADDAEDASKVACKYIAKEFDVIVPEPTDFSCHPLKCFPNGWEADTVIYNSDTTGMTVAAALGLNG